MPRAIADIRRDRLRELINARFEGLQVTFASALSMAPNYVSRLLSGNKTLGEKLSRSIEVRAGLPPFWLDQELPPSAAIGHAATGATVQQSVAVDAELPAIPRTRVPVVPLGRVGSTKGITRAALYEWRESWVSVPMIDPSETAFAVHAPAGLEPTFPAESLLIVDPTLAPADRDFLLVSFGVGTPTVRQLVTDGDLQLLAHPVPGFPMRPLADARVVGVVIQHIRNFR